MSNIETQNGTADVKPVEEMTDRELLTETVQLMRTVGEALAQFQTMGMGGIMKAMMSGKGKG